MNLRDELLTDAMLEVGRKAVEECLIEWRDSRISTPFRGNVIRMGPEDCIRIGLQAMLAELDKRQ